MTCHSRRSMRSFACPPTASQLDEHQFASGRMARIRSVPNPAAEPRFRFLRWLSLRRTRLPRLEPRDLSEHMLRDLGFLDGRRAPPLWD